MSERIANIQKAVEKHAGCRTTHLESVRVVEGYLDQIMWEGVVEVFDLDGHPKANRAYGWRFWGREERAIHGCTGNRPG